MWSIDALQEAWKLASKLHNGQQYGGQEVGQKVEYLNHVGSVTFEVLRAASADPEMDADLAIKCAVLHDTIEDTELTYDQVLATFGQAVADGVSALTKNEALPTKAEMMADSLQRIRKQPREVWAVKMADRICNLYAPPFYWDDDKKTAYRNEALTIHEALKDGNDYLARRLKEKIDDYQRFITQAA